MNATHVELMQRLEQFQLDSPEASLPFSARLARENNWTPAYTRRVLAEYKRFAFLAVAAEHPVSPSEDVDQAWHLHLTYSGNYWKTFCPLVLGKALHHEPTQGGDRERDKFDDWYGRTLESYEAFFGEAPPRDIWPTAELRRDEKQDFVRVDRSRNFVIPKPRFNLKYLAQATLFALAFLSGGAMLAQDANPLNWRGPDFLVFYVVLFAACFAVALALRRNLRTPATGRSLQLPELNGYEIAFLNGGRILAVNTAIANLIRQRAMMLDAKRRRLFSLEPKPAFTHDLEKLIFAAAASSDGNSVANVRLSARSFIDKIAENLKSTGLVVPDVPARKAMTVPLLVALAAVAFGTIKIFVGLSRNKPVGFLIALCIITGIISLITFLRRPLRSRYGDAVLRQLRSRHIGSRRIGSNSAALSAMEFAAIVGLFGMPALAGTEMANLSRSLQPPGGSSGFSSGCGGGGCGGAGGCGGGCGGCGGGG